MENIKIKIKEVYLPFLLVSILTILFYNLFRWTFDIKLGILHLKEDIVNFWMPFILPWIPVLIWLRRRIRILNLGNSRNNGYFIYQGVMVLAMVVPIFLSQKYIETAPFKLIEVNDINEIKEYKKEKFFKINSFDIEKKSNLSYGTSRSSGKNNEDLNFYLYILSSFKNSNNIWYGVQYSDKQSNFKSDEIKNSEYRSFITQSESNFENYDFQNVSYFEKLSYSDDRDGFMEAIKESNSIAKENDQIILVPKTDVFENRLGCTFPWIFCSYGIFALIVFIMIAIPKINKKELNDLRNNKSPKDDDLKNILEFFNPRGPNRATAILILLNIIVFVIMVFSGLNFVSPTPKELLEIGGNRRMEVLNGDYWRLITSIFIHGGVIHLFMNLIGLFIGGILLEGIIGKTKLFLSFLICGTFASLASILWHENTVSVGASGAIFGLYGLILAFTVFKIYSNNMRGIAWMLLGLYAGVSLLLGFLGGIDNAAHFGGLISGFVIGIILILFDKDKLIKNANNIHTI